MSVRLPAFTSTEFRQALGRFPTGVTIVTACLPNQEPVGLTVSSFNSISLDPPLVFWALSQQSSSRSVFEQCERYVIHVLSSEQFGLAQKFAIGPQSVRFSDIPITYSESGALRLDLEVAAWFECLNIHRMVQGDHLMLIGQVEQCRHSAELPLIYHAGGYDLTPLR